MDLHGISSKYKGFYIDFARNRSNPMSLHVERPFVNHFLFFIFRFFSEPKMIVGDDKKCIPVTGKSMVAIITRSEGKFEKISSMVKFFWITSSYQNTSQLVGIAKIRLVKVEIL